MPPDSEATRRRAYALYEQALAEKNAGRAAAWRIASLPGIAVAVRRFLLLPLPKPHTRQPFRPRAKPPPPARSSRK